LFDKLASDIGDSLLARGLITEEQRAGYERAYVSDDRYDAFNEANENRATTVEERHLKELEEVDPLTVREANERKSTLK